MPYQTPTSPQNAVALHLLREAIASRLTRLTLGQTDCATAIPNLLFFRRDRPQPPSLCLVEPSLILVVQGEKQMLVGSESYPYNIEQFLITSLALPANSKVVTASPERPCVGLTFKLDLRIVAELIAQGNLPAPDDRAYLKVAGIGLGQVTPPLLDAFNRLLTLLDEPDTIPVLSPLIQREIHYRLLKSDQAPRLWQIAAFGGKGQRVAKAIDWLKVNYAKPLRIDDLAAHVQMSASSLHQHFRQLTAMSPLQYQKWLRLSEARRLMLNEARDAATAGFEVGYESPSQFSREYTRLFGSPPKRDISGLRPTTASASRQTEDEE